MLSKYGNYFTPALLLMILGISIACLVLLIGVDISTAQEETSSLIVETSVGVIRGLQADDGNYSMFLGIPYAKVNRSNPFGAAIPIKYFEGAYNAIDDSTMCPQKEEFNFTITGTLDCLDLNIYVPNPLSSTNKLPVMLYIFGGEFKLGIAGRYLMGPRFLVRHDVILVTMNYRLGVYGFLSLDTPEVPGNEGLRDQLIAMRWVKQNIQYFGGNPDDITIFGHSAGAISVDFHFYSQQELMFNKMILQSASSLVKFVNSGSKHRSQFLKLTEYLGLATNDINEAIQFLAQIDELSVIKACTDLEITFNPTIERDFPGIEKIISNYTMFLDAPKAKDISVMIGFTNGESDSSYHHVNETEFYNIMTRNFVFDDRDLEKMSNLCRKFFIGDVTEMSPDIRYTICNAIGDNKFLHRIYRTIYKLLRNNVKKLYQYHMTYVGGRNFNRYKTKRTTKRVFHADELGYLFDIYFMKNNIITPEDQLMIDRFTTLWTNFAKYGDPTPTPTSLLPVRWLPFTLEKSYYYTIDTEISLGLSLHHDRMAFWDLFYLHNKEQQIEYSDMKLV